MNIWKQLLMETERADIIINYIPYITMTESDMNAYVEQNDDAKDIQ